MNTPKLSDLTPEQQTRIRVELYRALDWDTFADNPWGGPSTGPVGVPLGKSGDHMQALPNPFSSLDECARIEARLTDDQRRSYIVQLMHISLTAPPFAEIFATASVRTLSLHRVLCPDIQLDVPAPTVTSASVGSSGAEHEVPSPSPAPDPVDAAFDAAWERVGNVKPAPTPPEPVSGTPETDAVVRNHSCQAYEYALLHSHANSLERQRNEMGQINEVLTLDKEAVEFERNAALAESARLTAERDAMKAATDSASMLKKVIAERDALSAEVKALRDKETEKRLEWLITSGAYITHSKDGDCYWLVWPYGPEGDSDEPTIQPGAYDSAIEAIDAARALSTPASESKDV